MVLPSSPEFPGAGRSLPRSGAENTVAIHRGALYRPVSASLAIAPTVSVIIPARNEAANLPYVFGTLPPWIDEIILVDGHSVDDTVAVARAQCPTLKLVTQPGRGKGDALQAGFAAATGDILVTIDADGSTDGTEIIRFVSALVAGADYAKGSRFSSSGGSDDITGVRRYGNRLLSVLVNRMFGTHFTDLCYGYNAFWARHLDAIEVSSCPGFEVETLMNIRAAKAGLRIYEVPSHESPRIFGASNLHAIRDGWRILKLIIRERLGGVPRRYSHSPAAPAPAGPSSAMAGTAAGPYRMPGRDREPSVHDRDIVAAITEGDDTGVAAAFGRYAQGLYSYCRLQLTEPADAASAVRDTFLVAAAEAARLSQPDRLRAWLFALARNECQRRLRAAGPSARLYEAAHAMDNTGTFAVVTTQAQSRALVRAALAGLDPVDREISELNLRHGFHGADLADILGVPPGQAHTLAARARTRFERSLGVLTLARSERDHCRELAAILDEQDAKPAPSLRWRIRRHVGRCEVCGVRKRGGLNPAIVLGLLPAGPPPAGLRHQTLSLVSDRSPAAAAHRALVLARVLDGAPGFRASGFPEQLTAPSAPGRRLTAVAAVAAAVAALAVLGAAMYYAASGHAAVPPAAAGRHTPLAGPAGGSTATRAPEGVPPAVARAPSAAPGSGAPAPSPLLRMAGRGAVRIPGSGPPESGPESSGPGTSPSGSPSPSKSPSPPRSSVPPSSPPPSSPPPSSVPPSSAPPSSVPPSSVPPSSVPPSSVPPSSSASATASATAPGTTTS
jgi:DNA-directed RNA polymerase specialized sigma24 family protein